MPRGAGGLRAGAMRAQHLDLLLRAIPERAAWVGSVLVEEAVDLGLEDGGPLARAHALLRLTHGEMDGERVGSVFVVRKSDAIAKLRLLIIDPKARGRGLGKRFVDECLRFARETGYTSMTLWTQSCLLAARGIYVRAGFKCVAEEPHHSFGVDLIGETWERDL